MADDVSAGKVRVEIVAEIEGYLQQLRRATDETQKTEKKTVSSFKKMSSAFVGISAAAASFGASAIKSAYDYGNAIMDMRDKTGLASQEVSKLFALGTKGGLSNNEMVDIFSKFAKSADQAARASLQAEKNGLQTITAYDRLGVSLTNASGEIKSMDTLFMEAAQSLQGFADGASKTALEMELFGRSGGKIHDTLHLTQEEMKQTIEQARRLGLILTNDQAEGWKKVQISGNDFSMSLQGISVSIGNTLLPTIEKLTQNIKETTDWLNNLDSSSKDNIATTVEFSAKLLTFAGSVRLVTGALSIMGITATGAFAPVVALAGAFMLLADSIKASKEAEAKEKYGKDTFTTSQGAKVYVKKINEGTKDERIKLAKDVEKSQGKRSFAIKYITQEEITDPDEYRNALQQWVDKKNPPKPKEKPAPNINDAVYNPGSSAGSEKQQTELQKYIEKMNEVISVEQKRQQLGQVTRAELQATVAQQLAELDKMAVGEDEKLAKINAQLDAQIQLKDIIRQTWDDNSSLASESTNLASQQVLLAGFDETAKKIALQEQLATLQKNYELLNKTIVAQDMQNQKQATLNSILIEQQRIYSELNADELDNYKFALSLMQKKLDNNVNYLQFLEDEKKRLAELIILREQEIKTITDPEKAKALQKELNLIKAQVNAVADSTKSAQRSILTESKNVTAEMVKNWISGMGEIMSGTKTAVDYANDLFNSLLDTLFKLATNSIIDSLFSSKNSSGQTPIISNPGMPSAIRPKANGGHTMANTPYIVGETGRELFYPRVDGYIQTASQTKDILNSEMPNIQINIINNTNSEVQSDKQASFDGESYVVGIVLKNVRNSQDFRDSLKGAMS